MSPATIAMQNSFTTLDAKFFAPSGSYQLDGGVTAIKDGSFNIYGVARAFLQPEMGLGYPQGSTPPTTPGFNDSIWNPSFHLSYNPASTTAKYTFPDCSAGGAEQSCTPRPDYSAVFNAADNAIAPVGSATPATADRTATEKAAKDAKEAFLKSDRVTNEKIEAEKKVWEEAAKIVSKTLLEAYDKAVSERIGARWTLEDSTRALAKKNSVENANAFGEAAAQMAASEEAEEKAFDAVKAALPFELATRLDWARTETLNALAAEHLALNATHVAQQALESLPQAAPSPAPSPSAK